MTSDEWIEEVKPLVDARNWDGIADLIEASKADRDWGFALQEAHLRRRFVGVFANRYLGSLADFWSHQPRFDDANPNFAVEIWDAVKGRHVDATVRMALQRSNYPGVGRPGEASGRLGD